MFLFPLFLIDLFDNANSCFVEEEFESARDLYSKLLIQLNNNEITNSSIRKDQILVSRAACHNQLGDNL